MKMIQKAKEIISKALALGRLHLATDKQIADQIYTNLVNNGYIDEMLIKDKEAMEIEVMRARDNDPAYDVDGSKSDLTSLDSTVILVDDIEERYED